MQARYLKLDIVDICNFENVYLNISFKIEPIKFIHFKF